MPPTALTALSRDQLMAYRILTGGLDRAIGTAADLPLWDLGLQDLNGSAAGALAARLPRAELDRWLQPGELLGDPASDSPFAAAWTLRGSPHLHRRGDLQKVADALWPADEKDAMARLVGSGKTLVANGSSGLDGYRAVADGMRAIVTGSTRKPEVSTALTAALPDRFAAFCAPCDVVHVMEMLFRCAALPGGIGLVPNVPATLQPLRPTVRRPAAQAGLDALVDAYLLLYGAATRAEVAAHLGTQAGRLPSWPDAVPVVVDGVTLQTRPDVLAAVRRVDPAAAAGVVRLLPPGDPLLQSRERSLLVADTTVWKQLWPAIGPAGAVLAGGGIAGYWRPKKVTVTITGLRTLRAAEQQSLRDEAQLVAAVRGVDTAEVVFA